MKLLYAVLALVIIGSATATTVYSADYQIPSWTKNVALYWGQGEIEDGEYVEFLQFLVDEEIITIPNDSSNDVSQLENKVASLESEISSLKSSIATDLKNAYDDGYSAGIADQPSSSNTSSSNTSSSNADTVSTITRTIGAVEESGFSTDCVSTGCYTPTNLSANIGDKIIMTNTDSFGVHTFTSGSPANGPSGVFDSGVLMSGESFEWTPTGNGYYDYFCILHTWMQGSINVGNTTPPVSEPTPEPEPTPSSSSETITIGAVEESGFSQSCAVSMGGDGCYTPVNVSVNVGDTIVMSNSDPTGVHTFTSGTVNGFTPQPDGTFDTGVLMSGDAFEWTPTESGEYPYYCMLHTWMVGTITVN